MLAFGVLDIADKINYGTLGRAFVFMGKHSLVILLFHPMITTLARLFSNYVLEIEHTGILLSLIMLSVDIVCCIMIERVMRLLRIDKFVF